MAFYEHGVVGQIWRYAHIATVVSPYESRHAPAEAPFQRGINTFQLASDGTQLAHHIDFVGGRDAGLSLAGGVRGTAARPLAESHPDRAP